MKHIERKQNTPFILDGKKYKAVAHEGCNGCAFDNSPLCYEDRQRSGLGSCSERTRSDKTNVIFMRVTQ